MEKEEKNENEIDDGNSIVYNSIPDKEEKKNGSTRSSK